ncbi:MAG: hypothetical protein K8R21_00590 [Leptospira sp.]|nr:hypothetical protein [Leptospira sp.]
MLFFAASSFSLLFPVLQLRSEEPLFSLKQKFRDYGYSMDKTHRLSATVERGNSLIFAIKLSQFIVNSGSIAIGVNGDHSISKMVVQIYESNEKDQKLLKVYEEDAGNQFFYELRNLKAINYLIEIRAVESKDQYANIELVPGYMGSAEFSESKKKSITNRNSEKPYTDAPQSKPFLNSQQGYAEFKRIDLR